jgi:7,8-dihydro-6-hydroxymethylpterin dimethyltransferase
MREDDPKPQEASFTHDCMVCGAPLVYPDAAVDARCAYCGAASSADVSCTQGHFVCDTCHSADATAVIEHLCETSTETDLLALFARIRAHPSFHVHGPEHHVLVPAVMVAAFRNAGGALPRDALRKAIERGGKVPGGFCGLAGTCGAPTGVSIGYAVLLGSTPMTPSRRQTVLDVHARATRAVARYEAARCCQRDCLEALRLAAALSGELLPVRLEASAEVTCDQVAANRECIATDCPQYPG